MILMFGLLLGFLIMAITLSVEPKPPCSSVPSSHQRSVLMALKQKFPTFEDIVSFSTEDGEKIVVELLPCGWKTLSIDGDAFDVSPNYDIMMYDTYVDFPLS